MLDVAHAFGRFRRFDFSDTGFIHFDDNMEDGPTKKMKLQKIWEAMKGKMVINPEQ